MKTLTLLIPSADFEIGKLGEFLNEKYRDNHVVYFPEKNLHPKNIIEKCVGIANEFLGNHKSFVVITFSPYVLVYFNYCQYKGSIEAKISSVNLMPKLPLDIVSIAPISMKCFEVCSDFSQVDLNAKEEGNMMSAEPLDSVFEDLSICFEYLYDTDGKILRKEI